MFKSRATGPRFVLACTRRVSLSTSVEMIGDGDLGEVVIEAKGRDVALFQASNGSDRESHLTTGRRRGNLARGRYRTGCVSI